MTNTTPRPWHIGNFEGDVQYIYANTPKFELIAKELKPADAALIVTAVNAHDDLVKALEGFIDANTPNGKTDDGFPTYPDLNKDRWDAVIDFARSALAKAKGETK